MDRNDFSSMAAYADMLTQMNQAPRGLGPVAPGPEGVLSPESQARMLAYEEELKRQQQVPQLQHTPIDQIVSAMAGGNAAQPAVIGPQADFSTGGAIPRSDQPDFSNPARTLPRKTKVKQPTEKAPKPQEQQTAPAQEQSAPEPTPETTQAAAQEIQKAVQEVVKTPEDEQLLNNAINRPTEDGSQSIAQRIAMIAMAVAPTAVGMALGGKKGAYIGGKATGDGLTAGTKTYIEEDELKKKMDLEREKIKQDKEEKKAAAWVEDEDEYGRAILRNKFTNEVKPSLDEKGQQIWRPNEPIVTRSPITGAVIDQRYKYKLKEGDSAQTTAEPIITLAEEIDRYGVDAKELKIPKGIAVPAELNNLATKFPGVSVTGKKPDNISQEDWSRLKETYLRWKVAKDKQIEAFQSKNFDIANKPAKGKQPSIQEKSQVKSYENDVTFWNKEEFWKKYQDKQAAAESFFNRPANEITTGVKDAAIWMSYMKEVQQDQSVVREGDMATVQSFLSMKQRIGSFLNQYAAGKSRMTDELRRDVLAYLQEIRRIKEKNSMLNINTMVKKGMELGYQKPIVSSVALQEARDWFSKKGPGTLVGMAANNPIWNKRIPEMVTEGKLKNGDVVRDTDGDPYIVRFLDLGNGKVAIKTTYWAVP